MTFEERLQWLLDTQITYRTEIENAPKADTKNWYDICNAFLKDGSLPPGQSGHPPPHP